MFHFEKVNDEYFIFRNDHTGEHQVGSTESGKITLTTAMTPKDIKKCIKEYEDVILRTRKVPRSTCYNCGFFNKKARAFYKCHGPGCPA